MKKPRNVDSLIAYPFAMLCAIIGGCIIIAGCTDEAGAAPVCRSRACNVAHQQAVVAAAIPYPVVGYQVGQHLQQQAVDEYGFRSSPSQQRLTFLEGYYAAKQEEVRQTPAATPAQEAPCETCEKPVAPQAFSAPPTTPNQAEIEANHQYGQGIFDKKTQELLKESGWTGYQGYTDTKTGQWHPAPGHESDPVPEMPPELPVGDRWMVDHMPLWLHNCAECHSGDNPDGNVDIGKALYVVHNTDDPALAAEGKKNLSEIVADGHMPKGKKLTDEEKGLLLLELHKSK